MILDVEREPGEAGALVAEIVMRGHGHRLGVDHGDVGLVGDVHVDVSQAVGGRLLGRAAQVDRAEHGAILGVDDSDMRHRVAQHVDAIVECVGEDAVRIALHVDRLDQRQRLRVEHRHRLAADKPVPGLVVDGHAVAARIRNLTDRRERVQIEHRHPARNRRRGRRGGDTAARNVQTAPGHVGIDVVESAGPADLRGLEHFVGTRGLRTRAGHAQRDCDRHHRISSTHHALLHPEIFSCLRAFVANIVALHAASPITLYTDPSGADG